MNDEMIAKMAAHYGFMPEDDDAAKMAKVCAKFAADSAAPPPVEMAAPVEDEEEKQAMAALSAAVGATPGTPRKAVLAMAALKSKGPDAAQVNALVDAKIAEMRANDEKAARDKEAAEIVAMARTGGATEDDVKALTILANNDLATARAFAKRFSPDPRLFTRTAPAAQNTGGAVPPVVERGNKIVFGNDLAHAIRLHREKNPSLSYEAAADAVAKAQPHLLTSYFTNAR